MPAGLPWPNPECPVIMVECEDGKEEVAQAGNVGLQASSFFNRAEALLALRQGFQLLLMVPGRIASSSA